MPTYEYRCSEGHRFEAFQKISDDPLDTCPECGASARRLVSAGAGLLFKGDGFYITDYRSEEYKKKAASESGDGSSGNGGGASAGSDGGTGGSGGASESGNGGGTGDSSKGAAGGKNES